jgi:hypothetical protein
MSRSLISRTQYVTVEQPGVVFIASPLALPGGAAFTTTTFFNVPRGNISVLELFIDYLSASAAGQLAIRPQFSDNYGAFAPGFDFFLATIDPAITVAQPFGAQPFYEKQLNGPIPGAGNRARFVLPIPMVRGALTFRFQLADLGAAPGSVQRLVVFGGT